MDLVFNELSFLPYSKNEYILKENFLKLMNVYELAKKSYGFSHIIFPTNIGESLVTPTKSFLEWVYGISNQGDKNKILSIIKRPFGNEILAEKTVDLSKFYYVNAAAGIEDIYCSGLATAYLKEALCISLSSMPHWIAIEIGFKKIISEEFETEDVSVNNISINEHFEDKKIKYFIEYSGQIVLLESDVKPESKPIALRDDHGKDKLLAFSKRLVRSKYVKSVINSLPFSPKAVNLIKDIYSDGKIELVLYWEDKGIGLVIQTMGRNYRETEAIAEKLKTEFDR